MRMRWVVLLAAIVVGCSLSAFAGPQIGIGDPSCNSWDYTLGPLINVNTSNQFNITTNLVGGGFFGVCNQTGVIWNTVDIKFIAGSFTPNDITCTSTVFDVCDKSETNGVIDLFFYITQTNSNGDSGGIPKNQVMTINLYSNCNPETTTCTQGEWPADFTLYGGTNTDAVIPTPEPVSLALLGTGMIGLLLRRRR